MAALAGRTRGRPDRADAAPVLVVGCGFVGRHMAAGLAAAGRRVAVLSRREPFEEVLAAVDGADVHVGDASDPRLLAAALEGAVHVVWCAGGLLPADAQRDPEGDRALTLDPLRGLLAGLGARTDVSVTYVSSGGTVYGNPDRTPVDEDAPARPIGVYGATRLAAERTLLDAHAASGLPVRILRCSNVYGEHQPPDRSQGAVAAFLQRVRDDEEIVLIGGGRAVRDFVHVGDVVAATNALLGRPGPRVLNVGSGRGTSIRELLAAVERVLGRRARVREAPARPFDVERVVLDVRRLRALVPYAPLDLAEGLARTAAASPVPAAVLR